jgi:hypothetical protein
MNKEEIESMSQTLVKFKIVILVTRASFLVIHYQTHVIVHKDRTC